MSKLDVSQLSIPPIAERIRRIEAEPLPRNIPALLAETCAEVPDELAWNFFESDEAITYRELAALVERAANGLASIGLGPGSHVGVMLPNVAAFPTAWLALARIGAVMAPVNTRYTSRELHYVLENSEANGLVIHESLLPVLDGIEEPLPRLDGRIVVVGEDPHGHVPWRDLIEKSSDGFTPEGEPALDDLMNIQFTSGTTGLPKGCLLSHRYWLTCAKVQARGDFLPFKRILAATPFFYMTPQWLLLAAFYQRGTLYVSARPSARRFMDWVRDHRIHFCLFPEAVYRQPPAPLDGQNELIRVNIYGHNGANHADMEYRFAMVAREGFGMTEVGANLFVPVEATDMVGSGSIGVPTAFRECRVADAQGNTLAAGEIGELLVRGPGLFGGYYRKPEATAAAFHGDWFRTGDLARLDERGYFYFLGRMKDMIRRSGENIAAREVELILDRIPSIAESAAVPVADPERGEEVKVYIVLKDGATPESLPPERIIEKCAKELAVFKLPRYLEYREAPLPRVASGSKVAKLELVKEKPDLRTGCWDRVEGRWL